MNKKKSIYEIIGEEGTRYIVWHSMPPFLRFAYPCMKKRYRMILNKSHDLEELLFRHREKIEYIHYGSKFGRFVNGGFFTAKTYKLFRPRYRKVKRILKDKYNVD